MKVVMSGAWLWEIYQQACSDALTEIGVEVIRHDWGAKFDSMIGRWEAHTCIAVRDIYYVNHSLIQLCKIEQPDVVFIWSCRYLFNSTLRTLKKMGIYCVGYTNDDPFGVRKLRAKKWYQKFFWWRFKSNIPHFDMNLVYREDNIADYQAIGSKNTQLLPAYFVPKMNYVVNDKEEGVEGVFIGHFEPDERERVLLDLKEEGFDIQVFGTGWEEATSRDFKKVKPLRGASYNQKISSALYALCFYSKINRDKYTRRVFEITAAGTLLVAPYNNVIAELFEDGTEALLYRDIDDLKLRLSTLVSNPSLLRSIADNGHRRCLASGYDVGSRMRVLVKQLADGLSASRPNQ